VSKLKTIKNISLDKVPQNIDWWIDIEQKYRRDLIGENRITEKTGEDAYINFFSHNISYQKIKDGSVESVETQSMPCNCTD